MDERGSGGHKRNFLKGQLILVYLLLLLFLFFFVFWGGDNLFSVHLTPYLLFLGNRVTVTYFPNYIVSHFLPGLWKFEIAYTMVVYSVCLITCLV